MDPHAIDQLEVAGVEIDPATLFRVPIRIDKTDRVVGLEDDAVPVTWREEPVMIRLKPITALFSGNVKAPSFHAGPTPEYAMFFAVIEATAADCAALMKPLPEDREFERIYRLLKRHPDGRDKNPIFSYVQAAVRLYMSLTDVSRDVFEATVARIALSVKHFSRGPSSTNYLEQIAEMFLDESEPTVVAPMPGSMQDPNEGADAQRAPAFRI